MEEIGLVTCAVTYLLFANTCVCLCVCVCLFVCVFVVSALIVRLAS